MKEYIKPSVELLVIESSSLLVSVSEGAADDGPIYSPRHRQPDLTEDEEDWLYTE